jgi:uncharacterized membrane protein YoaK (UPF0700 family)
MRKTLLLGLAVAAGYVDALSYLGLGRVFTANMTGNTVLLAIALAERSAEAALRSGLALGGFLAGALVAAGLVERDASDAGWPPSVTHALMLETLILAAFGFGWELSGAGSQVATDALILLSALAMGVQSAAVHRLELSGITTTYITGTLTHLVAGLIGRERRKNRPWLARPRLLAAVWLVYIGGATAGAAAFDGDRAIAVALPAVLIAAVAAAAAAAWPIR